MTELWPFLAILSERRHTRKSARQWPLARAKMLEFRHDTERRIGKDDGLGELVD